MSLKIVRNAARHAAVAVVFCFSLSAYGDEAKSSAPEPDSSLTQVKDGKMESANVLEPRLRAAGEGVDYQWGKDHIFVKLSSAETGGLLTLIQDNLKPGFNLGLHFHRTHTEIFYILDGEIEFTTDKTSFTAKTGSVVYLPAGTPHAANSTTGGRMLMFYAPGGFDKMLAEIENATWLQRLNPLARAARDKKYDFNKITGDMPTVSDARPPVFVNGSEGDRTPLVTGSSSLKLSSTQTGGLATVMKETLKPGFERVASRPGNQAEILYVLDGELELSFENRTQMVGVGATMYLPAGVHAKLNTVSGATFLVYRTPARSSIN